MRKSIILLGSTAMTLSSLGASAAVAQDNNDRGLEEIVVTARRIEENLQKVPVAVTAISAKQLEARKVTTVSDIQFSVPNLQIKPSNLEPSRPEFIIRGQRQVLYTDENVVTYVNGVAQTTRGLTLYDLDSVQALKGPQGTLFGKNSMGGAMVFTTKKPVFETEASVALEIGNYDRKQVNAMVNVPFGDKVALRAVGQIERQDGFFKNFQPGMKDLADRRNESFRVSLLTIPSDRFENLFVADFIHRNEIPTPSQIEAAPANADGSLQGGIASITGQAVQQLSLLGGGVATLATNNSPSVPFILQRTGNPFVSQANTGLSTRLQGTFGVNWFYPTVSTLYTGGTIYGFADTATFQANDSLTIKNIIGYRHEDIIDQNDPSGITGGFYSFAAFGVPLTGPATNFDTIQHRKLEQFSEELQFIGNTANFNWIAGGYYAHQRRHLDSNSSGIFGPLNFTSRPAYPFFNDPLFNKYDNQNDTTRSLAVFAQGTYDFSSMGLNGLKFTAGLRYTNERRTNNLSTFFTDDEAITKEYRAAANQDCRLTPGTTPDPAGTDSVQVNVGTTCLQSAKRTYKALTWNASLEYQVSPDVLTYIATRRGFKAGGPNFSTIVQQYDLFGPERITDIELGVKAKGSLGGMPYRFNLAGFYGWYKQIQTQDILAFCAVPSAASATCSKITDLIVFNVGGATIKGVELDASIKPIPQVELNVGYSYQVGRYSKGSVVPQATDSSKPVADDNPIDFASGVDLTGVEFAGTPRSTLTVAGTIYADFIPESFAKTSINMNYYYRSSTLGLTVQGIYRTPSFGVANARVAFDSMFGSPFSLAMWMSNVFDKHYRLACADNLNSIAYATCKWGDPRTYGLTAQVKF